MEYLLYSAGCVLSLVILLFIIRRINRSSLPRGIRKSNFRVNHSPKVDTITRDRYSLKKVPKDLDCIVVGSGPSGLATAAILARVGQKVLVLEQHYVAGGTTHVFEDGGYEFEPGVHYIGNWKSMNKRLSVLTDEPVEWSQCGREGKAKIYDRIAVGDEIFEIPTGTKEYFDALKKKFPEESAALDEYHALVKKAVKSFGWLPLKAVRPLWLQKFLQNMIAPDFVKYTNTTTKEVMDSMFKNETLKTVLCGEWGDIGVLPSELPFSMHAGLMEHYYEGGYYPKGGPGVFAEKIIPTILKAGGRVLVTKGVDEILVSNGKTTGVRMENGDIIKCPKVVSTAGITTTFNKLLPKEIGMSLGYKELMESVRSTSQHLYLFLGFKGTAEELGIQTNNIWVYPDADMQTSIDSYMEDPLNKPMMGFIGSGSAKDEDSQKRYPGKTTMIVISVINESFFEQWEDERCDHRGEEYEALKQKLADRMLKMLYRYYPQLEGKVDYQKVGTPLTTNYYLGRLRGESYGLDETANKLTSGLLTPWTQIKGLYLSGQDITTVGVSSAFSAGFLTAASIMGYGTLSDIVFGRDFGRELGNLMKSEQKLKKKEA